MSHYIYIWIDPRTGNPFYVGKGCNGRAYQFNREKNQRLKRKIRKIQSLGLKIIVRKIFYPEARLAFEAEMAMIKQIGRAKLLNLTDGGEGSAFLDPVIGSKRAQAISRAATMRWSDPQKRAEQSIRVAQAKRHLWSDPKYRAETSARIGCGTKRAMADPKIRDKMMAGILKREANPELFAKRSIARKRAMSNPENRARISASVKEAMKDPECRAKYLAGVEKLRNDPERFSQMIAKQTYASRLRWSNPFFRAKHSDATKKAMAEPDARARYLAGLAKRERNRSRAVAF
jgi:hypothetical protein